MEAVQECATGFSLLVVEDEAGLRSSIADYFCDSGFRVIEAASGREGLALFRTEQPDILFTDLSMPEGNGLELITAVHGISPQTPIIVISGAGMVTDAVLAMKEGACDYLCKPVRDLAALEHLARKAIERSRQQKNSRIAGEAPLTGLPDRSQLEHLFQKVTATGNGAILALIDLDSFKSVKDAFGHAAADRLLIEMGKRLTLQLGQQDAVIHLGGDEFALLLATPDRANSDQQIASVHEAVAEPFRVGMEELLVTASIGVASFPLDGNSGEELLKHAATALYEAKKNGKNSVRRYCRAIRTNSERFSLQAKLRRAIEQQEFSLVYQPQYDLGSRALHGIEALLRWQPKFGDVVALSQVSPPLEESGLIVPVGEWVLWEACTRYLQWQSLGAPPCMLSVNVSAVQFHSSGFVDKVRRILQETGMAADRLCLELTESVVMRDGRETIATLCDLKRLGIALSLDDFGKGYSSLSYLSRMPLDELKIDRSFVSSLPHNASNDCIVDTIIVMAANMKLRVVAEGVEREEQAVFLQERNCPIAQGYYFSYPLTPEEMVVVIGKE